MKIKIAERLGDCENTLRIREGILFSLRVTPVIALELARIIQAMDNKMKDSPQTFCCAVVHGENIKPCDIEATLVGRYTQYTPSLSRLGDPSKIAEFSGEPPTAIIVAVGSEEEMHQLGDVVTTVVHLHRSVN